MHDPLTNPLIEDEDVRGPPRSPSAPRLGLLQRWRRTGGSASRGTHTHSAAEPTAGAEPEADLGDQVARISAMAHDLPVVLQERTEAIIVLECNSTQPSALAPRTMTRRELLGLASEPPMAADAEWLGNEIPPSPITASASAALPSLTLRDVRRLDPTMSHHSPPALLIRKHAMLLSVPRLGPKNSAALNVIIRHNRVYFLARAVDDPCAINAHGQLVRLASSCGAAEALPFEFLALEAALLHACTELQGTAARLTKQVGDELGGAFAQMRGSIASAAAGNARTAYLRRRVRELGQKVAEELALATALGSCLNRCIDEARLPGMCLSQAATAARRGSTNLDGAASDCEDVEAAYAIGAANGAAAHAVNHGAWDSPPRPPPKSVRKRGDSKIGGGETPDGTPSRPEGVTPSRGGAAAAGLAAATALDSRPPPGSSAERSEEAAELILEAYLHETAYVTSALRALGLSLDRAAVEVSFQMDSARNRLLHFEVIATSVGTAMSVGKKRCKALTYRRHLQPLSHPLSSTRFHSLPLSWPYPALTTAPRTIA